MLHLSNIQSLGIWSHQNPQYERVNTHTDRYHNSELPHYSWRGGGHNGLEGMLRVYYRPEGDIRCCDACGFLHFKLGIDVSVIAITLASGIICFTNANDNTSNLPYLKLLGHYTCIQRVVRKIFNSGLGGWFPRRSFDLYDICALLAWVPPKRNGVGSC